MGLRLGPPGTRTWSEIGQSEGEGGSSHTAGTGWEVSFPISGQWAFGRAIGSPPIVRPNVHLIT